MNSILFSSNISLIDFHSSIPACNISISIPNFVAMSSGFLFIILSIILSILFQVPKSHFEGLSIPFSSRILFIVFPSLIHCLIISISIPNFSAICFGSIPSLIVFCLSPLQNKLFFPCLFHFWGFHSEFSISFLS